MSGGAFDYVQYRFQDIIDKIETEIEDTPKEKPEKVHRVGWSLIQMTRDNSWMYLPYDFKTKEEGIKRVKATYDNVSIEKDAEKEVIIHHSLGALKLRKYDYWEYENGEYYLEWEERTILEFRRAITIIKEAYIYAQRIDRLFSGDDSEDTFHDRLASDLERLYSKEQPIRTEELCQ